MSFVEKKEVFLKLIDQKEDQMAKLGLNKEFVLIKSSFVSSTEDNFLEAIQHLTALSDGNREIYDLFFLDDEFFKIMMEMRTIGKS